MKASQVCIELIKRFESLKLDAYLCPAGILTIGYGHTLDVHPGQHISADFADVLLLEDVEAVENDLSLMLHVSLAQGQWDALVSLCFNLAGGARALPKAAPRLWADLHCSKWTDAARELLDMDHANGRELPGLKARRVAEASLFLSGVAA